jgi:hypothetical protein
VDQLSKLGDKDLKAGMPARVMIRTGDRTLAKCIWKPIRDGCRAA